MRRPRGPGDIHRILVVEFTGAPPTCRGNSGKSQDLECFSTRIPFPCHSNFKSSSVQCSKPTQKVVDKEATVFSTAKHNDRIPNARNPPPRVCVGRSSTRISNSTAINTGQSFRKPRCVFEDHARLFAMAAGVGLWVGFL